MSQQWSGRVVVLERLWFWVGVSAKVRLLGII
jgi:hypothetical protein